MTLGMWAFRACFLTVEMKVTPTCPNRIHYQSKLATQHLLAGFGKHHLHDRLGCGLHLRDKTPSFV